jgi:3-hydroxybutyryl-CoA dehydrogenase
MVTRGDVGIRSGRGFYDWRNRDGAATQRRASERLQRLLAYLEKDAAE